ncbi:hypothetical protein [Gracilimonas sp.]|uniref:hypothetical protein n=1 Tax=Gracilimonas sp. TaxID=1974203 RepID=UPI002870EDA9|nr:hypothetical protein [Gracilimonas sp.]
MMNQRLLVFLLFLLAAPMVATAQDGQAADNSLLPEINPQDIEIRSEFQARFPGLRRQPILGFNPKPRVYQIDPNRMPFLETREEAVADISITQLGRPEPPARYFLSIPARTNAYLRAGFGSYLTPEVNGYGFFEPNEKSIFSANLNYRGSDGHLPDQKSGFHFLDLNTQYHQQTNDKWSFSFNAGAFSDQLYMYDLAGTNGVPEKVNQGASAEVIIRKSNNAFNGMEFTLGGSLFDADLKISPPGAGAGNVAENMYYSSISYYWPGKRMYETFDITAEISGAHYNTNIFKNTFGNGPSGAGRDWIDSQLSVTYELLLNLQTRIKGKVGVAYANDPISETFYFAPDIEIKHNLNEALSVSGNIYAKPVRTTFQDHQQYNPFIRSFNQLLRSYNVDVNAEVNYQLIEGNRIFGGMGYQSIDNYSYYQRVRAFHPINDPYDYYRIVYEDANIFEIYGGASHQLVPSKFWADAKVYVRSPKLKGGGTIPYEEKLGLEAAVHFKPIQDLKISGWGEYIGKRESPETNSDLGAFLLLNFGTEYQINDTFGVYAKLLNIMDQQYEIWNGYTERPFQIFGGLTVKF